MKTSKFDPLNLQDKGEPMLGVFLVDGSMRRIAPGVGTVTTATLGIDFRTGGQDPSGDGSFTR